MLAAKCVIPVKTYTINTVFLYTFDELSPEIQESLLSDEREQLFNDYYYGQIDREDFFHYSAKVFDLFKCEITEDRNCSLCIDSINLNYDILDYEFKKAIKYILSVYPLKCLDYDYKQRNIKLFNLIKNNAENHNTYKYPDIATSKNHYTDNYISGYYTDKYFFDSLKEFISLFNKTKDYTLNLRDFIDILESNYNRGYTELNKELYSDEYMNEYIKDCILNDCYYDKEGNIVDYKILSKEVCKNE